MPKLLMADGTSTWAPFLRLIVALLRFLEPYLREMRLTDAMRMLYKVPPPHPPHHPQSCALCVSSRKRKKTLTHRRRPARPAVTWR